MSALLKDYLAQAARRRFAWGTADCGLLVADWVALALGADDPAAPDPAAPWRGRYASESEARALLGFGGVQRAVARRARALGLTRTTCAAVGDIGVVTALRVPVGARREALGAIRVGAGWVLQSRTGIMLVEDARVRVLSAWRVPWPRR